jgi:hypothetical protein
LKPTKSRIGKLRMGVGRGENKREEMKENKTLSQINKAQWHQVLERFPSPTQHLNKGAHEPCR